MGTLQMISRRTSSASFSYLDALRKRRQDFLRFPGSFFNLGFLSGFSKDSLQGLLIAGLGTMVFGFRFRVSRTIFVEACGPKSVLYKLPGSG